MDTIPHGKICARCGIHKPLDTFPPHNAGLHGRRRICIECVATARQDKHISLRACTYCGNVADPSEFVNTRRCRACASHRVCPICKRDLPIEEFISAVQGKSCRECHKTVKARKADSSRERYLADREASLASRKAWKDQNKPRYLSQQRDYRNARRVEIKRAVIEHYGGACSCCGETEMLFLTLDHIHGDGAWERKALGMLDTWLFAYRNNFPDRYRILCFNCNSGRARNGGICPHERAKHQPGGDPSHS